MLLLLGFSLYYCWVPTYNIKRPGVKCVGIQCYINKIEVTQYDCYAMLCMLGARNDRDMTIV